MSPTIGQTKLVGAAIWCALTSVEVASKVAAAKTVIFEDFFFTISPVFVWNGIYWAGRSGSQQYQGHRKGIDKIVSVIGLAASLTDNSTASQACRFCDQH